MSPHALLGIEHWEHKVNEYLNSILWEDIGRVEVENGLHPQKSLTLDEDSL